MTDDAPSSGVPVVVGGRALAGVVVSGSGEAAAFVALPWFRDAVNRTLGFDPFPGTLNVRLVDDAARAAWRAATTTTAIHVAPPGGGCGGRLVRVRVDGAVAGAVIVPDVTRHGDDVLEVLAATHLRTALGRRDGDRVILFID